MKHCQKQIFCHKHAFWTTNNTIFMPRGGATAYGSRAVCHYAEGRATEAYCNRAVCHSVCPSFTSISRRSLKTKRWNKQHKQVSIFARICIEEDWFWSFVRESWRDLDLHPVRRLGWWSGLFWRQKCRQLTACKLVGSICSTGYHGGS